MGTSTASSWPPAHDCYLFKLQADIGQSVVKANCIWILPVEAPVQISMQHLQACYCSCLKCMLIKEPQLCSICPKGFPTPAQPPIMSQSSSRLCASPISSQLVFLPLFCWEIHTLLSESWGAEGHLISFNWACEFLHGISYPRSITSTLLWCHQPWSVCIIGLCPSPETMGCAQLRGNEVSGNKLYGG